MSSPSFEDFDESSDSKSDIIDDTFVENKEEGVIVVSSSGSSDEYDDSFLFKKKTISKFLTDSDDNDNGNNSDFDNREDSGEDYMHVTVSPSTEMKNQVKQEFQQASIYLNSSDDHVFKNLNSRETSNVECAEVNENSEKNRSTNDEITFESDVTINNSTSSGANSSSVSVAKSVTTENSSLDGIIDLTKQMNISSSNSQADNLMNNTIVNNLLAEQARLDCEISEVKKKISSKTLSLNNVNLNILPDNGLKLKVSLARDQRLLESLKEHYSRIIKAIDDHLKDNCVKKKEENFNFGALPSINLDDMGRRALKTHQVEQSLTVNSLRQLHGSLNTCPSEDDHADDPTGLKVPLMLHQKQALAWLLWREKEKPAGGILADDMGLGKTLTMLSLIVKQNGMDEESESDESDEEEEEAEKDRDTKYYKGGTLIISPSSVMGQWESEIKCRIKSGVLSFGNFHGSNREKKAKRLARLDIVITSYNIVRVEFEKDLKENEKQSVVKDHNSVLYSIKWERIILDEAHIIRNSKCKTSVAVYQLKSKHRWALTGTPIHNKSLDYFSLIKFLRCKPFNDVSVWKKWIEARDETGLRRLNLLTKSLMLRRTKAILKNEGKLGTLPEKTFESIVIKLSSEETSLYEEVAQFSKALLSQLLHQKAEKENLLSQSPLSYSRNKKPIYDAENNPFSGHPALERLFNKVRSTEEVKTYEILVLLLRLRQICCHPALMKSMIEKELLTEAGINDEDGTDLELLEKMSSISLADDNTTNNNQIENKNKVLDVNNPIFKPDWMSSKVKAILELLDELSVTNDKVIVVSQWTSMLELLQNFLVKKKRKCDCLSGKVPVSQRMQIVNDFNNESSKLKILLLSLTAGGTGLNLIGGNHLILTDIHWNPQLEAQACDRIYRVGQKKEVKIYKFICSETIEERILKLQQNKLELADDVLTGVKRIQTSKLSLNDLKLLFNVNT